MILHRAARLFAAFTVAASALLLCAAPETNAKTDHQSAETPMPKPPPDKIVESAVIDVQYRDGLNCASTVDVLGVESFDRLQVHADTPTGCGSSTA